VVLVVRVALVVKVVAAVLEGLGDHTETMTLRAMALRVEKVEEEEMEDMVVAEVAALPSGYSAHLMASLSMSLAQVIKLGKEALVAFRKATLALLD
jgi:hypothetical protein